MKKVIFALVALVSISSFPVHANIFDGIGTAVSGAVDTSGNLLHDVVNVGSDTTGATLGANPNRVSRSTKPRNSKTIIPDPKDPNKQVDISGVID